MWSSLEIPHASALSAAVMEELMSGGNVNAEIPSEAYKKLFVYPQSLTSMALCVKPSSAV
jgi:hypothetical protein